MHAISMSKKVARAIMILFNVTCDLWYHGDCMHVNLNLYQASKTISWICCYNGVPNFTESLLSSSCPSSSLSMLNSLSSNDFVDPTLCSTTSLLKDKDYGSNKTET